MNFYIRMAFVLGITLPLLVFYSKVIQKKLFKKETKISKIINIGIFLFILIIVPLLIAFSFDFIFPPDKEMFRIIWKDDTIWCIEKVEHYEYGELSADIPADTYTIHIVNADSGTKYISIDSGEDFDFYYWQGTTGWYKGEYGIFGAASDGRFVSEITEEKLNEIPELSAGIADFYLNPDTFILESDTKDGLKYYINPLNTDEIQTEFFVAGPIEINLITNHGGHINNSGLSLSDDARKKFVNSAGDIINDELYFLNGKIINSSDELEKLIIASYKTTDEEELILSCADYSGNLLWQIDQKDFGIFNILSSGKVYICGSRIYNNNLLFVSNGYVLSVNMDNSTINWRTGLYW